MIDKMSNYIVDNMLYRHEKIEGDQREIMLFGITRIIEDVPKYIIIVTLCCLMGLLKELALAFGINVLYKTFLGGAHARTNLQCLIFTTLFFLCPILLAKYVSYNNYILIGLATLNLIFSIYTIMTKAPADTEEIPIINKLKRKSLKNKALVSLFTITILTAICVQNIVYIKIIMYSIFLLNIMTTKIMYRLLGCKYGYESEEYKAYYL